MWKTSTATPPIFGSGGEIDLILPLEGAPAFDGVGAGWCVFPPDSAHCPTVTGGSAHVLNLLPEGEFESTGK